MPNPEEIFSISEGILTVVVIGAYTPFAELTDDGGGRQEIPEL
jgi:hypothetical protein